MSFFVVPEYIAAVVLAILIGYAFPIRILSTFAEKVFRFALVAAELCILCNILSIYAILLAVRVPLRLNYLVNSLYFLMLAVMATGIALSVLALLYEGRYRDRTFRIVFGVILVGFVAYCAVLLANRSTGCLFRFDENLVYVRGPLNKAVYLLAVYYILALLVCYVREWRVIRSSCRSIAFVVPVIALALGLIQVLSPATMITGTVAALSLLVLFIFGQQQRLHEDRLTELMNRDMCYASIERSAARGAHFHVISISLCDYKSINTRFGQRGGDRYLHEVGRWLLTLPPRHVTACRFTGVEFALIVTGLNDGAYEELISRIVERFRSPFTVDGEDALLKAAVADIAFPEHAGDADSLIVSLEYAARFAKQRGDGAPVRFDKQMKNEFGRRVYLISQLEAAFLHDRYLLRFQPVVEADTERPVGAEALVRMCEENGAIVSPVEFIPLAEEIGLAPRIGWLVMEMTLRFLSEQRPAAVEWISVNVTAQQYLEPDAVEHVCALLARYDVPPTMLKLEITERMLISDLDKARETIDRFAAMGVGVCLDDFGTGYSNLANVLTLPVEYVKLDRSFLVNIETDQNALQLFETIVNGMHAMRLKTLAEGVETDLQRAVVRALGVDRIQGFYYARPLDGAAFLSYMAPYGPADPS